MQEETVIFSESNDDQRDGVDGEVRGATAVGVARGVMEDGEVLGDMAAGADRGVSDIHTEVVGDFRTAVAGEAVWAMGWVDSMDEICTLLTVALFYSSVKHLM